MDLIVNGRFLGRPVTGVERYAHEVSGRLSIPYHTIQPRRAGAGAPGHLWEQLILPLRAPRGALLWSPANTGPLLVRRQVVTIHDLAPLEHPEWFRPWFAAWYRWLLPRLARRVRRVLTVSEFSRERMIGRLALPSEKVDLARPGVGPPFKPMERPAARIVGSQYGLIGPYLIWVGTLEPRKNLERLLRAWDMAASHLPDCTLVLIGAAGQAFPEAGLIRRPPRVRWLGRVPDRELAALYSGALALVYVPLYEGFGLPPLEAMACGCPVMASRAGGLPEAVGEAALMVDPENEAAITAGLIDLVGDDALRAELRARGLEHADSFSWEATARTVYRSLEAAWRS